MSTLLLDKLLKPASIVVIGASARLNSPGYKLTQNLLHGEYTGQLYLVNPRYSTILEQPCYKSVKSLPAVPDLAILIIPPQLLRRTLVQCAAFGIKVAIVMSGTSKPQDLHRYARRLGMRLMGPYCAGIIRPHLGLNATYSANRIYKGDLAVVSESAALAAAMLDWAETSNVGFSALISTGQETDITLSDLLDLLANDIHTRAVIVYVENITASRSFLSALSATARIKPVVLMRSSSDGVRYCNSLTRTGQVYNSDSVFQVALNRAGVVRIRTFSNLYAAARILSSRLRVKGNRLAIVSNANAPALMALERIASKHLVVDPVSKIQIKRLKKEHKVHIAGDSHYLLRDPLKLADHYQACIRTLEDTSDINAVVLIFVPDSRNDANLIAQAIVDCLPLKKPLLTCFMGDASVIDARAILSHAGVPCFRTPEAATDGFDFLHRYFVSQQQLLQLPNPTSRNSPADVDAARTMIKEQLRQGERVLGPMRTLVLMRHFDIPVLKSARATSIEEALSMANNVGYPVAMKLVSPNISYKSTVVGTQLNISNDQEARRAWQLIETRLNAKRPEALFSGVLIEPMYAPDNARHLALSISRDPEFGPVISVGLGGDLTALMYQRHVQLPPLNKFLVKDILNSTELQLYLGEFRHAKAVKSKPLGKVLRRLSELACEIPELLSLDINPLILSEEGAMAMDIRVVIEQPGTHQRYGHLAIHPYPSQWIRDMTLKDGSAVQLRPIRPEDASSLQNMVRNMSDQSRYFRFMHSISELSLQMVAQFTKLDYDRQMAFVATGSPIHAPSASDEPQPLLGVSRYMIDNDRSSGEFAVSVSDDSAGKGLAKKLMLLLLEHAASQGLQTLYGDVLRNNKPMQGLMKSLGFKGEISHEDHEVIIFSYQLESYQADLSRPDTPENSKAID